MLNTTTGGLIIALSFETVLFAKEDYPLDHASKITKVWEITLGLGPQVEYSPFGSLLCCGTINKSAGKPLYFTVTIRTSPMHAQNSVCMCTKLHQDDIF